MSEIGDWRVCAVLGMHRSGTSWLAGSLQETGLELGEVSESDPHNRKGNRESKVLMRIHDTVLGAGGGSWKRPGFPNRWPDEQRAEITAFVSRMNEAHERWGFKDPRALFVLDEWRRQVPEGLTFVGIYRHPLAVHASLSSRNPRFDERKSVRLWKAYNERVVEEHRRDPFPILRFDVETDRLLDSLRRVVKHLGLDDSAGASFFDEGLVHNAEAAARPVPWACRKLWRYLEEHCG